MSFLDIQSARVIGTKYSESDVASYLALLKICVQTLLRASFGVLISRLITKFFAHRGHTVVEITSLALPKTVSYLL